ncbi:hypothetical protein P280DRAFT_357775, partial [Massarina eburnea CBS 473.64]
FQSKEWCMRIINSRSTETIPWPSRPGTVLPDHPCSLFAQTLNTSTGIRAVHVLWEDHPENETTGQALLLVSIGDSMNYYPKTLHGGMVAALADGMYNHSFSRQLWLDTLTAKINLVLRGRVETPGVCLVREWADDEKAKKQGKEWTEMRKLWGRATIEDRDGHTLVEAHYMFI